MVLLSLWSRYNDQSKSLQFKSANKELKRNDGNKIKKYQNGGSESRCGTVCHSILCIGERILNCDLTCPLHVHVLYEWQGSDWGKTKITRWHWKGTHETKKIGSVGGLPSTETTRKKTLDHILNRYGKLPWIMLQ